MRVPDLCENSLLCILSSSIVFLRVYPIALIHSHQRYLLFRRSFFMKLTLTVKICIQRGPDSVFLMQSYTTHLLTHHRSIPQFWKLRARYHVRSFLSSGCSKKFCPFIWHLRRSCASFVPFLILLQRTGINVQFETLCSHCGKLLLKWLQKTKIIFY